LHVGIGTFLNVRGVPSRWPNFLYIMQTTSLNDIFRFH
jgi:hypothetical protein